MASHVSIVNTVEGMQVAVEEFAEHVDGCNINFKQNIMEKVKALKRTDTTTLTERVEELKGEEGSELNKLNAIYTNKKMKARQMEGQVSIPKIHPLQQSNLSFSGSVIAMSQSLRLGSTTGAA